MADHPVVNPRFRRTVLSCSVLLLSSQAGHAQTPQIPNIGDVSREVEASRPTPPPEQTPTPILIQEERPLVLPDGETLLVREFRLRDAEFIDEEEIQKVLAPYAGKPLTMTQINEAADKVTQLYRSRGYPVARAYVPRQDARDGVLTIQVLIGRYGAITIDNQSFVKRGRSTPQAIFSHLQAGEAITNEQLERAMLLTNDLLGAQVPRVTIAPGEMPGASDFNVLVPADKRLAGYVLADNYGSRYTGRYRVNAGLDINSPFGLGDKINLAALVSEDTGLFNGNLGYSLPVNSEGLRANIGIYRTTYELGKEYSDLDATGSDVGVFIGLSYPLLRSQNRNLTLSATAATKRLKDEIEVVDDKVKKKAHTGTLSAHYESWSALWNKPAYSSAGVSVTYGRLTFNDGEQAAMNKLGADIEGNFAHANLSLHSRYSLTHKVTALLTLNAQKALMNKNLDGSEQMSISGISGVQAYRESASGDNAYFINAELRYQLPNLGALSHALGAFAETGRSYYENGDYAIENGIRLSGVGLGYLATYKSSLYMKMQLAHVVGSRPDQVYRDDKTRFLAQVGAFF